MSVEIYQSARPKMTARGARRVIRTGPLAAFNLAAAGGAVLVSSCCALPLVFAMAGLGGAWLGKVSELGPYEDYVLAAAVLPLAVGWTMAVRHSANGCSTETGGAGRRFKIRTYGVLTLSTALVCLAALSDLIEPGIVAYLMSLGGEV
jgi:mercuric ion transport protein